MVLGLDRSLAAVPDGLERRIGAQRASAASTVGPPTTVLLAWVLLGERLTIWQIAGIVIIIASVLFLESSRDLPAAP